MITAEQVKAARVLLNWSQMSLAEAAGLGLTEVIAFEYRRAETVLATMESIKAALERAGIEFTGGNGAGPGVLLKSITAEQIRAARKLLGWSREELAARARVPEGAIIKFELGIEGVPAQRLAALRRALEKAGVDFQGAEPRKAKRRTGTQPR
jgi:transcriptional regulator with XRE-family HTH domain